MSKVSEIVKKQASKSVMALNPQFFGLSSHQIQKVAPSLSGRPISQPKLKLSHSSSLSDKFKMIWKLLDAPKLEEEFKFHPERKFRVDFCHLATRTCIEIEGGIFNKRGGHSSITGILRDIEKYNEMVYLGFRLIRFHANSINFENLTRLARFLESRQFVS